MPAFSHEVLKNDRILRACYRKKVDRTPVWLMRQAGRYLPKYRELKKKYSFLEMCRTPALVADATLQPLELFDLDAVILFSDILIVPLGLGFEFEMKPGVGPVFLDPMPDPSRLVERVLNKTAESVTTNISFVYDGVAETRRQLKARVPLIGFAGAPWTLMCYMVDGSADESAKQKYGVSINWLYENPEASLDLMNCLAQHVANHLINQVEAGCHLVQLFDSLASYCPPGLYRKLVMPSMKLIVEKFKSVHPNVPIICFAKGAHAMIRELSYLPFNVLSVDTGSDLSDVREQVGGRVGVQGNMDPLALFCSPEVINSQVEEMLRSYGEDQIGYIANLGHGCLPSYDPKNVGIFVDAVHRVSSEMLAKGKIAQLMKLFGEMKIESSNAVQLELIAYDPVLQELAATALQLAKILSEATNKDSIARPPQLATLNDDAIEQGSTIYTLTNSLAGLTVRPVSPVGQQKQVNDSILKACRGEQGDKTAVWLYRQAGAYMPEYKKLKKESGLESFAIFQSPEFCAQVTLQPVERFGVDAAILFSDILVIPKEMGFPIGLGKTGVEMRTTSLEPIDLMQKLVCLDTADVITNLEYVYEAVRASLVLLDSRVPLIGFAGAPWTLLGYIIDGVPTDKTDDSLRFIKTKSWLDSHLIIVGQMLQKMAEVVANHLIAQAKAGCQLLQIFEPWGYLLDSEKYVHFALPALKLVVEMVKSACPDTPIVCFAKGIDVEYLASIPFDVVSLDYDTDLLKAKKILQGKGIGIQGNMDPRVLLESKQVIEQKTKEMIDSMGNQRGYIANLGHGCLPEYNPDHVGYFVDAVHKYSAEAIGRVNVANYLASLDKYNEALTVSKDDKDSKSVDQAYTKMIQGWNDLTIKQRESIPDSFPPYTHSPGLQFLWPYSTARAKFVIGSRKSKLAMIQSNAIKDQLSRLYPNYMFVIKQMETKGDQIQEIALSKIGDKGLFTQELEQGMLDGTIDFAVHSLKDLPTSLPKGLVVGCVTERVAPEDVVLIRSDLVAQGITSLSDLNAHADAVARTIGTSSLRRQAQLSAKYPNLAYLDCRGNVDTRIKKLEHVDTPTEKHKFGAIILARAGLIRQGEEYTRRITQVLTEDIMYYAVGQGALGIECRAVDNEVIALLSALHHTPTASRCIAERAFMHKLEGGCHAPIAVTTSLSFEGSVLTLKGRVMSLDGTTDLTDSIEGGTADAENIGTTLAERLLAKGARDLVHVV